MISHSFSLFILSQISVISITYTSLKCYVICHNILSSTALLYSLVHLIFSVSAHHLYMYKRHYLCILSIKEEKKGL